MIPYLIGLVNFIRSVITLSPSLSRENYFLTVINQFEQHLDMNGSLEHKLQELILDIVHAVQNKQGLNTMMIQRINHMFSEYQAVRLKVGLVSEVEDRQQILLHTEFIDEPHQLRRMYMEALISLLEAMEKHQLELQRCIECNNWFIPYQRAQVTKFCSSKCRNRYNYVIRKREMHDYNKIG